MNNQNISTIVPRDFRNKSSLGGGETMRISKTPGYYEKIKLNDFEQTDQCYKFIDVYCDNSIIMEIQPPLRIRQYAPPRSADEVAKKLEEKMQQNLIRRQNFINRIKDKSQRENEKVAKIREKMAAKLAQNTLSIETDLELRKLAAQKSRQKFIDERMEKFRKQIEHAKAVRSRKQAMIDNQR